MATDTADVVDRIAMLLGGGLVVLGVAVLGLINALSQTPPVPQTNDAGQVVAEPLVPPDLRAYVVALGLVVWLVYALYKLRGAPETEEQPAATLAD